MDANKKDEEMQKLKAELQQIKEANSNQFGGPSMMQICIQIGEKFGELKKEMDAMKTKVRKLVEENAELKENMDKMKAEFVGKNTEFEEKMRELQEKKADKKEVADLTGRIDGMEFVQMKNNKWNAVDCGPKLDISEGGLFAKHNGPNGVNCIRAISPISPFNSNATNPSIAGYFEAQIVKKKWDVSIDIGFCTEEFLLEGNYLGEDENSIGIWSKEGMDIDGQFNKFGNNANGYFNAGDVIGVGIIYFPGNPSIKCFATWNGQLLGTFELPDKFVSLQLFPAASLYIEDDSIRVNFGQETFRFDGSQLLK